MTEFPKITVVTPSFNQGRFLQQCIDSVLGQNYPNLEYIIIDGGSTDESVDIIESYSDSIDFWVSEKDGGQSNGINKGLRRATGDLVAWLNSDDIYTPNALHTIAEAYGANPSASFYYGNGYRGDEAGEPKERFYESGTCLFNREALANGLNYILQPSVFMNREMMGQVDHINEDLHYGMDTDLWLKLSNVAQPAAIGDCLSISREYEETKTSMGGFGRAEELRQIAKDHTGLDLTPGALLYYLHTIHTFIESEESVYPREYLTAVTQFWQSSALLLKQFEAGPNGTPLSTLEKPDVNLNADRAERQREFENELHAQRVNTPEFLDLTTQAAALNEHHADLNRRYEALSERFHSTSQHAERLEEERTTLMKLNAQIEKTLSDSEQDRQDRLDKLVEADSMLGQRDESIAELVERVELLQAALLESKLERDALSMRIDELASSIPVRLHRFLTGKRA